jgi:serine/threonine-protein kinase
VSANPGYSVAGVTASKGTVTAVAPYILSDVKADTTVTATFVSKSHTVTYRATPTMGGTITGAERILTGDTASVTVTAGSGYDLAGVTATNGTVTASEPYMLSDVTVDSTVTATFVQRLVSVPDLSGMTIAQAQTTLVDMGLTDSEANENSDTVPAGQVIRQDPAAGSQVAPGSPVHLVVSSGPQCAPSGCVGCFGGKSAFILDKLKKAFGDLFLGGLGMMVLLAASRRTP